MHSYGPFPALTDTEDFETHVLDELEPAHRAAFEELKDGSQDTLDELIGLMMDCDGSLTVLIEPDHKTIAHLFLIDTTGPRTYEIHAMDLAPRDNPLKAPTLDEAIDRVDALADREDLVRGCFSALRQFLLSHEEEVSLNPEDRNELVAYLNARGASSTL